MRRRGDFVRPLDDIRCSTAPFLAWARTSLQSREFFERPNAATRRPLPGHSRCHRVGLRGSQRPDRLARSSDDRRGGLARREPFHGRCLTASAGRPVTSPREGRSMVNDTTARTTATRATPAERSQATDVHACPAVARTGAITASGRPPAALRRRQMETRDPRVEPGSPGNERPMPRDLTRDDASVPSAHDAGRPARPPASSFQPVARTSRAAAPPFQWDGTQRSVDGSSDGPAAPERVPIARWAGPAARTDRLTVRQRARGAIASRPPCNRAELIVTCECRWSATAAVRQ
jgi:hypothetical protein